MFVIAFYQMCPKGMLLFKVTGLGGIFQYYCISAMLWVMCRSLLDSKEKIKEAIRSRRNNWDIEHGGMSEFPELRRKKQLGNVDAVLVPSAVMKRHDQDNL